MKAQFIDKLLSEPWNMDRLRARTLLGHIIQTLIQNERPASTPSGRSLPTMQTVGDVAIIPLCGVIQLNIPDWIKEWGLNITDANDIEEEIDKALSNPAVRMIVFDVDSPGGSALAGEKLFELVEAANRKKPCFGFCADGADAASTAYLAIASTQAILAGKFAKGIGCIGSFHVLLDDSEYWAKLGMNFRVFRSGDFKGIGEDSLSEEQASYLQSKVDQAGDSFRQKVKKYRIGVAEENMRGQWFNGVQAAESGFTAGTCKDLNAAISRFRKMME